MDTKSYSTKKTFEGVINNLERRYLETDSEWKREEISIRAKEFNCEKNVAEQVLKTKAFRVKINSLNISEITENLLKMLKSGFLI